MAKFYFLRFIILASVLYQISFKTCNVNASWQNFAITHSYTDSRLVVPENFFPPRLIPIGNSPIGATVDCSRSCVAQNTCYAFNIYDNDISYVCELLSDNLHRNNTVLQLLNHTGCSVWQKMNIGRTSSTKGSILRNTNTSTSTIAMATTTSQITTKITSATPSSTTEEVLPSLTSTSEAPPSMCAEVRYGCLGTFPNCHSCPKTCIDWFNRDDLQTNQAALWPDGDGPDSLPIYTNCELENVVLIFREIDLPSNTMFMDFIMPFPDMHRLTKLGVYKFLSINFNTKVPSTYSKVSSTDWSLYTNFKIGPDGTLTNLTYFNYSIPESTDVFSLGGRPMQPTPFVNVTDDRYNCGCFWLLDRTNATYCPGGKVGMFGSLIKNGTRLLSSGMRVPSKPDLLTYYVKVTLRNRL